VATSYNNLVNFCQVTPEIMELILCRYLYFAIIDLHICIRRADINAMGHWNADGTCRININSDNDQATLGINLVGF